MDGELKALIFRLLDEKDVPLKANEITGLVKGEKTSKKDVNRALYALAEDGMVEKDSNNKWNKKGCLVPAETIGPVQREDEVPHYGGAEGDDIKDCLWAIFKESPNEIFATKDLVKLVNKNTKKEINKYLYELKDENKIQLVAECQWRVCAEERNEGSDEINAAPSVEETDGPLSSMPREGIAKREIPRTGNEYLFDALPNIDQILLDNMWPGPHLLAQLSAFKLINKEVGNKVQDTRGVYEKCEIIITSLRKNKHTVLLRDLANAFDSSGQIFLSNFLMNRDDDKVMSKEDKELIRYNQTHFLSNIVLDTPLLRYLIQERILTDDMEEYITSWSASNEKIAALLTILLRCGSRALPKFREALISTGQPHTARLCDAIVP